MSKKLIPLKINRKMWGTGTLNGGYLRNENGMQCCLGFAMRQCHYSNEKIVHEYMPKDIFEGTEKVSRSALVNKLVSFSKDRWPSNTTLANKAATINDNNRYSDATREKKLTKLFREHGIKVTFFN